MLAQILVQQIVVHTNKHPYHVQVISFWLSVLPVLLVIALIVLVQYWRIRRERRNGRHGRGLTD